LIVGVTSIFPSPVLTAALKTFAAVVPIVSG